MERQFWSATELQKETGLSRATVYKLIKRADFPSVRLGEKRIVIPVADFYTWLEKQRNEQKSNLGA